MGLGLRRPNVGPTSATLARWKKQRHYNVTRQRLPYQKCVRLPTLCRRIHVSWVISHASERSPISFEKKKNSLQSIQAIELYSSMIGYRSTRSQVNSVPVNSVPSQLGPKSTRFQVISVPSHLGRSQVNQVLRPNFTFFKLFYWYYFVRVTVS